MSFFSNIKQKMDTKALNGLTGKAYDKICQERASQDLSLFFGLNPGKVNPDCLQLALGIACAAYPNAVYELADHEIVRNLLPEPIVDWNTAGRIAHEWIHFGEGDHMGCVRKIFNLGTKEFLSGMKERFELKHRQKNEQT